MIRGNGGRIDSDLAVECWEVWDASIRNVVRTLLVVDKLLDEVGEVWLFDFGSKIFRVNFIYCRSK
jgi:hypothetical protein